MCCKTWGFDRAWRTSGTPLLQFRALDRHVRRESADGAGGVLRGAGLLGFRSILDGETA